MSLPERMFPLLLGLVKRGALGGLMLSLAAVSACTVRPLYSEAAYQSTTQAGSAIDLSSVSIKPVETRYGQEVRNHLIFLLNGGSGQPANARYTLTLGVTATYETAAVVQVADENEPSAATMTVRSSYLLTEVATGKRILSGNRQITSSYDVPQQEFAAVRAQRDAENRAARELAELLRLALAQDLTRIR